MHPRRLRLTAATVTVLSVVGLAACGGSDEPGAKATPTSRYSPYAALGDSYTAVSGTDTLPDDACLRSADAYPLLLARRLGITEVSNVACGGATSENLKGTQYPLNKTRQDPQLDALSDRTRLVTVGIGLNDESFFLKTIAPCYLLNGREQKICPAFLGRPRSYFTDLAASVADHVAADLADIKKAAPNARIVFVGYPRTLPEKKGCPSQIPLAEAAVGLVRASGVDVNDALKKVAAEAGVDFLDMYAASKGHDVCSKTPWVNGQSSVAGEAYAFHPFPAYHVAVADKLAALLAE